MTQDPRLPFLAELERKILWLASWTIHNANHIRPNEDGMKVGGHQASSASLATIMTALYMAALKPQVPPDARLCPPSTIVPTQLVDPLGFARIELRTVALLALLRF